MRQYYERSGVNFVDLAVENSLLLFISFVPLAQQKLSECADLRCVCDLKSCASEEHRIYLSADLRNSTKHETTKSSFRDAESDVKWCKATLLRLSVRPEPLRRGRTETCTKITLHFAADVIRIVEAARIHELLAVSYVSR